MPRHHILPRAARAKTRLYASMPYARALREKRYLFQSLITMPIEIIINRLLLFR